MRYLYIALAVMMASTPAWAESGEDATREGPAEHTVFILQKDPLVAGYLSATMPGLGQIYSGHKGRGLLVLLGVAASFGTAAGLYEPARLELSDYDRIQYGGNGDGLLSISEVTNWEEGSAEGDAFSDLSGGRKAGIITAGVVGVGLYIWNIFDARKLARDYNEDHRISFGPRILPGSAGAAISLRF